MRTTLTLILTMLGTFCQGECPIECYCDRMTSSCTGDKLLSHFPKIYTSSSSIGNSGDWTIVQPFRLELHDYDVRFLSSREFLQMISNLTELSLTRNSLESIDNETFTLSSSSTSSPSRPGGASKISQEQVQQGTQDHFTTHHSSSSFSVVAELAVLKLRILDLSQNKLNYFVGGGKLKGCRILDLSSNVLQQVYELNAMESLESVNLRDNRISYLQPSIFQNLKYLQYVNVDSNILSSVDPSTFSNLPALAHLILSSNPISNLLPGFYWNSHVQFVDVSHVGLSSIPTSLTKTVRDFRCANNNLTIIRQTDFESYPNVGLLVLDENAIENVEDDAFGRMDFLTRLWMNGNRLTRIPQNLPLSLQSLHLEDNRLMNLSSSDFKNLRKLQELNLHGNRLSSIPPFAFAELTNLKNLDMRSNSIDVIYRDSFANLSSLETLDISQNPIKVIVTGAFGNLGKLSLLHCSRLMEPIEFDPSSLFSSLQKLQILELDDSPHFAEKLVQESSLSHLGSLVELNLQRCKLSDLNRVSNALAELNLRFVKISGNPWDCHDLYESVIQELMNRRTIADQPVCDHPPMLKGLLLSSVNFSLLSQNTESPDAISLLGENSSDENLLDFAELTPELENSNQEEPNYFNGGDSAGKSESNSNSNTSSTASKDKVTNVPNTNSPENLPHVPESNVNPFRSSASAVVTAALTNTQNGQQNNSSSSKNLIISSPILTSNSTLGINSSSFNSNSNPSTNTNTTTTTVPVHQKVLARNDSSGNRDTINNITSEEVKTTTTDLNASTKHYDSSDAEPTRSYFDFDNIWKSSLEINSLSLNSVESGGVRSGSGNKKPAIASSMPIERTRGEASLLDKTKTNDDNTIIDEDGGGRSSTSRRYSSSLQRRSENEEETGSQSIDGFPSGYSDVDRLSNQNKNGSQTFIPDSGTKAERINGNPEPKNPEAFYLRRVNAAETGSESQNYQESTSGTIILRTIIISAAACLTSIILVLSFSFIVYRISQRRSSGIFLCNVGILKNESEREAGPNSSSSSNNVCTRMSYKRMGNRKRGDLELLHERAFKRSNNPNHSDHDSDSDQVELSGITNRLYVENEEIYHIT